MRTTPRADQVCAERSYLGYELRLNCLYRFPFSPASTCSERYQLSRPVLEKRYNADVGA